jgi:hypothetical protein
VASSSSTTRIRRWSSTSQERTASENLAPGVREIRRRTRQRRRVASAARLGAAGRLGDNGPSTPRTRPLSSRSRSAVEDGREQAHACISSGARAQELAADVPAPAWCDVPVVAPSSGVSWGGSCATRGTGSAGKGTRMQAACPQEVPLPRCRCGAGDGRTIAWGHDDEFSSRDRSMTAKHTAEGRRARCPA